MFVFSQRSAKEIRSTLQKAKRTKSSSSEGSSIFLNAGGVLQLSTANSILCNRASDMCKRRK